MSGKYLNVLLQVLLILQPYRMIPEIQVGIYYVYLRDWMRAFPNTGVHVIRLEDWKDDPIHVYRDLMKFLELSE